MGRVVKNPWIVKGPTPNANASATRAVEHRFGGLGRGNVTVPDDWNPSNRLDHFRNPGKIHRSAEPLLTGAAVNENGCDANIVEGAGQIGSGDVLVVPSETHFGR